MAKNQCEWYDYVDNKPSKLHKDLIEKVGRPQGNMLYVMYKTSDAAEKMDAELNSVGNPRYKRNIQNQHNARDVLTFLDWYNKSRETVSAAEIAVGSKDANNNYIDYADSTVALNKANEFNDSRQHLVANVYKHNDIFHIIVSERNSKTLSQVDEVKEKLKIHEYYQQVFRANGIDINAAPDALKSKLSAYNDRLIEELQNLKRTYLQYMYKDQAMLLFFMNESSPHVQRLISNFGSIENAAQALDDINHGINNLTPGQKTLLKRAVTNSQEFTGLNLDKIQQEISEISTTIKSQSPNEKIIQELHRLNKKYKIDFNQVHRVSSEIESWSEAAADAVTNLERQIRLIEKEEGKTEEGKRLSIIKRQLLNELTNKKYASGIYMFLKEASRQLNYDPTTNTSVIDHMLTEAANQSGTNLEKAIAMAKAIQRISELAKIYYPLVQALSNENIKIDESINQHDIDAIRGLANNLRELFESQNKKMKEKVFDTMEVLMTEIVGNETPDGIAMGNALRMASQDSTIWDYLYSMGRASNPIIAAMGEILLKAKQQRNEKMNELSLRTRRATHKLTTSGSDSKFMYEDEEHIASPYDWHTFEEAKRNHAQILRQQRLDDWDYKRAMEQWIEDNTEEVPVDVRNGVVIRTERVPNENYRKTKDFQEGWTDAQKEYYDTMMQIKGEIGSLLPAYAQRQFLPPQVRREMLDAFIDGDIKKGLKNKWKDLYTIREDDEDYASNGVITVDGQDMRIVESDFDNTKLRQIPIFYINRVEQGELLKDFSGALMHLAGTAINYDAMNNVVDVVEFMGDFAKNQAPRSNTAEADIIGDRYFQVITDVVKASKNSHTENMINSHIAHLVYSQKLDPEQMGYKWSKLIKNIIGYTSFKGLATNVKGMFSNFVVGEFQMAIEAFGNEFYGFKNYLKANARLFGGAGVAGEVADILTNNRNHKATLFAEKFDPINENFSDKSRQRYYTSMFSRLVSKDCAFIGYGAGEFLIHYVNMYAILDYEKVLLNGKKISLYDAFEVVNKQDGNSELKLKDGVTTLNGEEVTEEYLDRIKNRIKYCNQSCHGSMNEEDKGAWQQNLMARAANNFRQWMWEHYSRRFRERHYDYTLGEMREGYWQSLFTKNTRELWRDGEKADAFANFIKDLCTFTFRAQSQWENMDAGQKHNVRRVQAEMFMYLCLIGLGFGLGEPDEHKKDFWRRWWIYHTKRLITEVEASSPVTWPPLRFVKSGLTILQSPVPAVNTANSLMYSIYGLFNGDAFGDNNTIKSGIHKGENRYIRNNIKYNLPVFKDWEQLQRMDEDESIFQVFKDTPSNR